MNGRVPRQQCLIGIRMEPKKEKKRRIKRNFRIIMPNTHLIAIGKNPATPVYKILVKESPQLMLVSGSDSSFNGPGDAVKLELDLGIGSVMELGF